MKQKIITTMIYMMIALAIYASVMWFGISCILSQTFGDGFRLLIICLYVLLLSMLTIALAVTLIRLKRIQNIKRNLTKVGIIEEETK
jgi:hypothetical protein